MLASTLLLLTYLFLIGAQDASNNISNESNTDSITVLKEESAIDNATRVLELTDLQFQEVLDKSANASSYVFAKVFIVKHLWIATSTQTEHAIQHAGREAHATTTQ